MNTHIQSTTQNYLEIFDVTNDIVILRDGSVAMVLAVSSINFGLLAEEEQDSIIYSYAGLLNSLSFPIEIVVRSQKKDVTTYLRYVQEWEDKTLSPLRKTQIRRYREFVSELVKERRILDKKFYVAIPYKGASVDAKSMIPSIKKKNEMPLLDRAYILERALTDLEPKRDHLIAQFGRIGLMARQLNTQELIQLLYTIYNPGSYEGQKMTDTRSYTTAVVEASLSGVIQQPALQNFTQDVGPQNTEVTTQSPNVSTIADTQSQNQPSFLQETPSGLSPSQPQQQTPPVAEVFGGQA
ncbi:MAG: hypothetical protein AAB612_04420 [Patescibacteria group bacterium]